MSNSEREPKNDLRWPWLDKLLAKFKVSDAGRAEVQEILRSPKTWLKGEATALDHLAPWEKLLFLISGFMDTASGQWDGRDRLFRYTFGVNPNHITVSNLVTSLWDAFNDPFIGTWMDRHPMRDNTYRWIRRVNHTIGVLMGLFYMLDLGLTPMQRIVIYASTVVVRDVLGTMSEVANAKYYAGITPLSDERGKLNVWENVGKQTGYPFGNIPAYIMGFARDRQVWSDYKVFTRGYALTLPLLLGKGILNTFLRNRVEFGTSKLLTVEEQAALETRETGGAEETPKMSLRESFTVIKHNKFMLYDTIAYIVTQFSPGIDDYPLKRWMFPQRRVFGELRRGEGYMILSKQLSGLPVTILYPFLGVITKKLGGPKRTMVLNNVLNMACHALRYFTGYKSVFGLVMYILTDSVLETMGPLNGYAGHILNYEMLDYVEWKTGVRSEGITMAFKAFTNKIVANNLNSFTGNAFAAWTGIHKIDIDDPHLVLPERYTKWVWPMVCLMPVVDNVIYLIARLAFPYDVKQKDVIEADLKERRALAEKMKEEIKEEAGVS